MPHRQMQSPTVLRVTAPVEVWYEGDKVCFHVSGCGFELTLECDECTMLAGMASTSKAYVAQLAERASNVIRFPRRHN